MRLLTLPAEVCRHCRACSGDASQGTPDRCHRLFVEVHGHTLDEDMAWLSGIETSSEQRGPDIIVNQVNWDEAHVDTSRRWQGYLSFGGLRRWVVDLVERYARPCEAPRAGVVAGTDADDLRDTALDLVNHERVEEDGAGCEIRRGPDGTPRTSSEPRTDSLS